MQTQDKSFATIHSAEAPERRSSPEDDESRWAAVLAHDPSADGAFYYSVESTGIFCRPSCPARRPKREHVSFHATAADARRAGYRPCKRCKPDQATSKADQQGDRIAAACRLIETADETVSLLRLAEEAGMSPYHFHRVFKSIVGVTPKAYAAAAREKRMHAALQRSNSVTEAIYDSGFNSSAPFYAAATGALGMTPTEFRAGGAKTAIGFAVGECSLGAILVAATAKGVCAILLGDDAESVLGDLQQRFPRAELAQGDASFEELIAKVIAFVDEPRGAFDLPLDIQGTAFQRRVWEALRAIPPGATASYGDIAGMIGAPKAVRAVGGACAANPLAIVIPCHRAIRSDGGLSGFRWGAERKRALLGRERK